MDDRILQPDEAENAAGDTDIGTTGVDNTGTSSVGPAPEPPVAALPPAAALAARLVRDIISRMGSPHAHGGPPLTHDVLWRQVVHRLGFVPQPQARIWKPFSSPAPPFNPLLTLPARSVMGPVAVVPLAPVTASAPFTPTAVPVPVILSRLTAEAASASPFALPVAPAPLPMPFATRRPPRHETSEVEEAPHEHAASRWVAYRTVVARTAPPSLPSSPGLDYVATTSLASELSRPLVQHTDLLVREERVHDIPLVPYVPHMAQVSVAAATSGELPARDLGPSPASSSPPPPPAMTEIEATQAQYWSTPPDTAPEMQEGSAGFVGRLAYLINKAVSALRSPFSVPTSPTTPPTPTGQLPVEAVSQSQVSSAPFAPSPARRPVPPVPPASVSASSAPPAPLHMPVLRPTPAPGLTRGEVTSDSGLPATPASRLPGQPRRVDQSATTAGAGVSGDAGMGMGMGMGTSTGGASAGQAASIAVSPPAPEAAVPAVLSVPPAPVSASDSDSVFSSALPVHPARPTSGVRGGLWGSLLARLTGSSGEAGVAVEGESTREVETQPPARLSMPWARLARAREEGGQGEGEGTPKPERALPSTPAMTDRPSWVEQSSTIAQSPAPVEHVPAISAVPSSPAGTGAGADVTGAGASRTGQATPTADSSPLPEPDAEPVPPMSIPEVTVPAVPAASASTPARPTSPISAVPPVPVAAQDAPAGLWRSLLARLIGTRKAPDEPLADRPTPLHMPWARPVRGEGQPTEPGAPGEGLTVTQVPADRPVVRPLVQPLGPASTPESVLVPEPMPARSPVVMPDVQTGAVQEQEQGLMGTYAPPIPEMPSALVVPAVPEVLDGPVTVTPGVTQVADAVAMATPDLGPEPEAGMGHIARQTGSRTESVAASAPGAEAGSMDEGSGGEAGEHLSAAWQVLSDMAEAIADAHEPLVSVEPAVAVVRPGLAGRLLARLARALDVGTAGPPVGTGHGIVLHLLRRALPGAGTELWGRAEAEGVTALSSSPSPTPSMPPVSLPLPVARLVNTTQRQTTAPDQLPTVAPSLAPAATLSSLSVSMPVTARPLAVSRPVTHMSASLGTLLHEYFTVQGGASELAYTVQGMGLGAGVLNPPISMPLTSPYTAAALEYGSLTPYYQPAYDVGGFGFPMPYFAAGTVLSAYSAQGEYTEPAAYPPLSHMADASPSAPSPAFSDISMPPATPYRPATPKYATFSVSEVTPASAPTRGHEPVHTWSVDMSTEGQPAGEAAAWAGVISSGVEGASRGTGTPALALAGEERAGVVTGATKLPDEEPQPTQPDVDRLADQVYSIIRRRLVIERERHW